jgi:flagellar biogenesis protein FliO
MQTVAGSAEQSEGLSITHGSGDAVNVSLDTESSFNVSIRRNEQAMIIRVPPSFHSKLYIDPALKANHVIQEAESGNGRTIVIESQQIYLSTHEAGAAKSAAAAIKREAVESNEGKEVQALRNEGLVKNERMIKPVFKESLPYEAFPNASDAKIAAQKSHTGLLSLTDESAKADSLQKKEHGKKDAKNHSKTQKNVNKKNANQKHTHLDSLKTASRLKEKTAFEVENAGLNQDADPESQPLDSQSTAGDPLGHTSALGWFRMTISLIIVLSLALGGVRWLLPKLIARYPEFFERLKSRQLTGQQLINPHRSTPVIQPKHDYFANNRQSSQNTTFTSPSPSIMETSMNTQIISQNSSPSVLTPLPEPSFANQAIANQESVKQPCSQNPGSQNLSSQNPAASTQPLMTQPVSTALTVSGQPMQVITSSSLEDGKALHLVDIQGRQFLVASTPDNITLLKDLTAPIDDSEMPHSKNKSFATRPSQPYTMSTSLPKPYCVDAEEVVVLPDYDDVYNSNM